MSLNSIVDPKVTKFYATGKRKKSFAKVLLVPKGSGKQEIVTGKHEKYIVRKAADYFKDPYLVQFFLSPLIAFKLEDKYDVFAHVSGGGLSGQSGAIKLAIAKAMLLENHMIKPELKLNRFLTQDRRFKERKKIGKYGARRSPQFTKR